MLSTVKNLFGEFMNAMIKKLLQGQAVEWRALGEVAKKISSGGTPKTGIPEYYHNGEIPWLRTQEVNFNDIYETGVKITEQGVKNSSAKWIPANCVIMAMYGATVGRVGINKIPMTTNQACANIEVNEEIAEYRYVYYCLANQYEYIKSLGTGSQTNINAQIVRNLKIPIPPLSIQSQIVQILDAFTELNDQLTTELSMRQKQYQYYRDFLLSEHELAKVGFEWKSLGEVANYEQPTKYLVKSKDYDDDFKTPVLTAGKTFILGYTNETNGIYQASKNPVIIFDDFTTANKWVDFDFKAKSSAMKMISSVDENQFLLKYIYYWLNTLPSGLVDGDHKRQWISNFANKKIPIPPLSVQSQIVAILDTFDTLTQPISEGLPKEIKLRQTQYEYYRERLLNFKATI
ncbi:type I restriction endonuclease subunit S [Moraxella catarrhalis]|nr:type I restriction endonuclease subunit S [Moraxella catarrhalis]